MYGFSALVSCSCNTPPHTFNPAYLSDTSCMHKECPSFNLFVRLIPNN